jgi:hypothetical protein
MIDIEMEELRVSEPNAADTPVPCHTRPLDCFQNGCFCAGCITGFSVTFVLFMILFALARFDQSSGSGHEGHIHQPEPWSLFW